VQVGAVMDAVVSSAAHDGMTTFVDGAEMWTVVVDVVLVYAAILDVAFVVAAVPTAVGSVVEKHADVADDEVAWMVVEMMEIVAELEGVVATAPAASVQLDYTVVRELNLMIWMWSRFLFSSMLDPKLL
jgi:hypothetical protein